MRNNVTLADLDRYFEGCNVLGKRDPIIENHETRVLTVLLWGLMGKSVCLRGESGSAKTKILNAVASLIYGDTGLNGTNPDLLWLNSSSAKGQLTPENASWMAKSYRCAIPELQNILTSQNLEAMLKLWMEERPYIYSRNELGRKTIKITLPPKPVLTNLADGNEQMSDLPVEMRRRIISLPTYSSKDLNDRVHHQKAMNRILPDEQLTHLTRMELSNLRNRILEAAGIEKRVINPGADIIRSVIPTNYTASNTFIEYFFDVIEAITRFYHQDRISNDKYLIANPEDNYLAFLLAGEIFRDMSIGITPIGKYIIDFVPRAEVWGDLVSEKESDAVHVDEILDYLSDIGIIRTKKLINETLQKLVDTNFIRKIAKADKYYKTHDFDFSRSVDWKKLIQTCVENVETNYPDIASTYKSQDLHLYKHPFTGKEDAMPTTIQVYGGTV